MSIGYQSETRTYALTPTRKKYGKVLARGKRTSIAIECMKDKQLREKVTEITRRLLKSELKKLCSNEFNSTMPHSKADD